jgi:hypothetical protein
VEAINDYIASKEAPLAFENVSMREVLQEVKNDFSVRLTGQQFPHIF